MMPERTVAVFQPTYFPSLHLLHRMARADVIVVLDQVEFRRKTGHHRAVTPFGTLTVPILRVPNRRSFFCEREVEKSTWRSNHIEQLRRWYPSSVVQLSKVFALLSTFSWNYTEGVCQIYRYLQDAGLLPFNSERKIVRQSWLKRTDTLRGGEQLAEICRAVDGTRYLSGLFGYEEYLGADMLAFKRFGITITLQDTVFPSYHVEREEGVNWSMLDVLALCDVYGMRKYLKMICHEGWRDVVL